MRGDVKLLQVTNMEIKTPRNIIDKSLVFSKMKDPSLRVLQLLFLMSRRRSHVYEDPLCAPSLPLYDLSDVNMSQNERRTMNQRRFSTFGRATRSPTSTTLGLPTSDGLSPMGRNRSSSVILMNRSGHGISSLKGRGGELFHLKAPKSKEWGGTTFIGHIGDVSGADKPNHGATLKATPVIKEPRSDGDDVKVANRRDHETKGTSDPKSSPSRASSPAPFPTRLHAVFAAAYIWVVPQLTWIFLLLTLVAPKPSRPALLLLHVYPFFLTFKGNHGNRKYLLASIGNFLRFKVVQKSPSRVGCPTIYGFHPHSKYPMGVFLLLSLGDDAKIGGLKDVTVAQSSLGKFIPTISFVTSLYGKVIDVTKGEINATLKRGKDVGLFPGGHREMLYCRPWSSTVPIVKHVGFLKLAMDQRASVTPTFTFGFNNSYWSAGNAIDMWCYENLGCSLPFWVPTGLWGGEPARMVVGQEIDSAKFKSVENFAAAYFEVRSGGQGGAGGGTTNAFQLL